MNEDIRVNIKIELGKHNNDFSKLKRIMEEIDGMKFSAKDEEEGRRLAIEELRRRLREAGLSVQ